MKTVIITGASSGIGRTTAQLFAEKNWKTLLISRNEDKLKELTTSLPHSEYFICDLSQAESIEKLFSQLTPYLKDIKALVNNAGIYKPNNSDNDNDSIWEEHFNSNLMSAVRLTRLLWPTLKNNKSCILNVSSTLALRPIENAGAYSALKAAMNNWTQSLALEGASFGVRANAICPGIVDTPIHKFHKSSDKDLIELQSQLDKLQPLGRIGQPQDIASTIVHMCSDECSWLTGTLLNIDGGMMLNSSPS